MKVLGTLELCQPDQIKFEVKGNFKGYKFQWTQNRKKPNKPFFVILTKVILHSIMYRKISKFVL